MMIYMITAALHWSQNCAVSTEVQDSYTAVKYRPTVSKDVTGFKKKKKQQKKRQENSLLTGVTPWFFLVIVLM